MKKYEFTGEVKQWLGRTLHRIRATVAFGDVKAGDVGGWIEKEENLSQEGNAWVYSNAQVCGNARVYGNAQVYSNAWVCGNAWVYGNARVCGNAWVYGNARVYGNAQVYGNAWVYGNAQVCGDAWVCKMSHYLIVGPIGSRNGFTTFFRTKKLEINVTCGCFRGNIEAFAQQIQETHGDNDHAKRYGIAIELAKASIDLSPEE